MTDAVSLIRAKRDGQRLADDDIGWLFGAYARGEVADEQMSALLMAIYFRGLDGATPNEEEAEVLLGETIDDDPGRLAAGGRRLLERLAARFLLITRGSRGMSLFGGSIHQGAHGIMGQQERIDFLMHSLRGT